MILARSLAAAALALGLAAPAAHADAPTMTGSLTLTVSAKAERALHARGVTLRTTGRAAEAGDGFGCRSPPETAPRCGRPERCDCGPRRAA